MKSRPPVPATDVAPLFPSTGRWLGGVRGAMLLGLGAVALFCLYATFRQRYIWGCDSYGYYALGRLISEGRLILPTAYPPVEFPAGVPLAFSLNFHGLPAPDYPPGLPLLLAIGHLLRAPMYVTPAVGVLSCGVMFLLLRRRVPPEVAILFTLAWAFLPVTVFGSTMIMSDLVAATALMAAYLAFLSGRMAATAWAVGFACWVRPTDILFLLPATILLPRDLRTVRLAAHFAVPCALYALYNYLLFGAPWKTGYGDVGLDFLGEIFWPHVRFYTWQSMLVLSPYLLLLVVAGLRPWRREKLFLVLWSLVFFMFYCFWRSGGEGRWWWTRFLLPSYPPLFLLAADGFEQLRSHVLRWSNRIWRWSALGGLGGLLAALPFYYVAFGVSQHDLWNRDTGEVNYRVIARVRERVPPGSVVGSVEFSGAFTLYSKLIPFLSTHGNAPDFVAHALADGRRAFLLVEPWNAADPAVTATLARFEPERLDNYDFLWGGLPFYELHARAPAH